MLRAVKSGLQVLLMILVTIAGARVAAETPTEESPDVLVDRVTREVMQVIKVSSDTLETDPQAFYDKVGAILGEVVAFDYISHGVMGSFASEATREQRQRFSKVFQNNLISTYAKGMVVYANLKIETQPLDEADAGGRKASVVQKVKGEDSEHTVVYSLGKSKVDNQWKLLNVIINGVNLGSTFRSQFAQAMKKHGDLDAVIANWST